ncbi:putative Integrase core domain [Cucumis melo var. makuwa]|uniref:Putative Integrase core domain n=1 Tax=Cucumis melo var. makuwa TaxID=1194695 RepID=A0A5D3CIT1_CUCMM|nr:putative Integrase core domain [Cucumis melo var. makuwa]
MLMIIGKQIALSTLLRRKKKEGATYHVCSSLQETSSFKQLEESEMTLKVGTGDVISARAVGDAKLDHINLDRIGRLVKNGLLNKLEDDSLPQCESCLEGKMTKRSFTGKDDYSRYGYLYLMEHKFEALEKFKEYKTEVENLLKHGIQPQLSAPGTPQQNDVSERTNRTLLDMVRSMMSYTQLPSSFWRYAVETAVYILNNVPSKSVSETPLELWRGRKPSLSHFKIWGCPVHVLVKNPKKLEPRSRLCQFVGYPKETRGGLFFDPQENRVVIPDDGVEDPLFYKQAMNDVDKDQWVKAMNLEMESMYFNLVWELVDLPEGPKGFITEGQEQKVCKLNRSIYGLKQASRSWNIRFDTTIKSYSFDQNVDEPCVYKKINKEKVAFLVLFVNDILLIGNDVGYLTNIKTWLAAQFQMKDLGEAQYVLGIQIIRDSKNKTLALSQATYIDKMLVRYSMQNSKKDLLPFRHGVHLSKEQCPKTPQEVEDMRRIPYASAMGSLMYAMLCTRPDICYAVGVVSRYQSNPGLDH